MRNATHAIGGIFLILFSIGCGESVKKTEVQKTNKKPNILFISIDDLRPDIGCYGNTEIKTPRIDEFANSATVFQRTYCQAAVCAPSRASLMTGLRPDSNHVWHLGDKFRELNPDVVTIPQHFKKFGYHTVNMGKIFHNYMPDSVSFDEPDIRPSRYNKPEMRKRDGETFYVDPEIQKKQKRKRDSLIALRPNYYADGWNNGPAWEMPDVHDTMCYDGAQNVLAIKKLKELKERDEPFFFALGYFRPHLPFVAPKKYWDLYDREKIVMPENSYLPENSPVMAMNLTYELRGYDNFRHIKHPSQYQLNPDTARILKHGYYASVSYIDALVGDVLDELKRLDMDDNTIVIIWGDHGWKLGEHNSWCKQTNYHIDTHVPMIIRAPGKSGGKTMALTELVDIYPTLCDLAGVKVLDYMQGTSVAPLLDNPEKEWKNAVFSQFHRRPKVTPDGKRYMGYSIQTKDFHLVEWRTWDIESTTAGEVTAIELYDHTVDPNENTNVAGTDEYKEKEAELIQLLKTGWEGARLSSIYLIAKDKYSIIC